MDNPLHFAEVQCLVLATELRNIKLTNTTDIEQVIGRLQVTMHMLFQVKSQLNEAYTND